MSIDIRTLHIGSHIAINGERERVRGLDEDNGLIVRFPAEYVNAKDVEPIAITAELLEELGFEWRKGSDSWLRYENLSEDGCDWGIIASEYGFDGWWQIMFHPRDSRLRNEVCCKYLHQLESILALHDVELIPD